METKTYLLKGTKLAFNFFAFVSKICFSLMLVFLWMVGIYFLDLLITPKLDIYTLQFISLVSFFGTCYLAHFIATKILEIGFRGD